MNNVQFVISLIESTNSRVNTTSQKYMYLDMYWNRSVKHLVIITSLFSINIQSNRIIWNSLKICTAISETLIRFMAKQKQEIINRCFDFDGTKRCYNYFDESSNSGWANVYFLVWIINCLYSIYQRIVGHFDHTQYTSCKCTKQSVSSENRYKTKAPR